MKASLINFSTESPTNSKTYESELYVLENNCKRTEPLIEEILKLPRQRPHGKMYGRNITLHRDVILLSNVVTEYSQSCCEILTHPLNGNLEKTLNQFNTNLEKNFNSLLINIFNNGSDNLGTISSNDDVFLFLGASRKLRLRNKNREIYADIETNNGQLILCTNNFMSNFRYEVPKQAKVKDTHIMIIPKKL